MLREMDELLREALVKAQVLPEKSIKAGTTANPEDRTLYLASTALEVEEQGMGGSRIVKKEEATETFETDGTKMAFTTSELPVKPLLGVEAPAGFPKSEPADYTVDYVSGTVTLRQAPEKDKKGLLIRYNVARATGEVIVLKLKVTYSLFITASEVKERNQIVVKAIDSLYRAKDSLVKSGVQDMRVQKATQLQTEDGTYRDTVLLTCELWTAHPIELPPGKALGKVEITPIKK